MKGNLKLYLAVVACCVATYVGADTEVNVKTAGTLSSLLPASDSKLKVTGVINGTDAKYLRQLVTDGKVTSLDLSGVRIIKGGVAYYESYKTENDVLGECMFKECGKLLDIVLPTSVTAIGNNAFTGSGIREVVIPDNVSQLGFDAFAYCGSLKKVVVGSHVSRLDQGVFYSSTVKDAYVKPTNPPGTPAYLFSSNPTIHVYSSSLSEYRRSGWAQYGTLMDGLEEIYPQVTDSSDVVNTLWNTWFEDAACTRLKATYQNISDEALTASMTEGGMPTYMIAIALKLKNGDWADYEQDFRIHSYKAYSDANYWNNRMKSTGGSYMGNPTGIYTKNYEPLYVFVDEDIPADATLYIAGCVDNDIIGEAKSGKKLSKGLNIVDGQKGALYYIIYTADTKSQTKAVSEWPQIKIHIEGGIVNGYYDVARHSDKDYQALLKAATHERFTIKGGEALFNFKTSTYKKVWPSTIDRSICWFDSLTVWEKELMGMCVSVASGQRAGAPFYLTGGEGIFPTYYNNPNFAIEGEAADAGWANSTPHRTSYNSVDCIRSSFDVSRFDLDDWCAAHECGHNNQGAINLEGGTEVSNNLFSNYIRFHDGLATSTGSPLSVVMEEYAYRKPFFIRPVDSQLRMYWQLYLYYHLAQKNTSFYPMLFKALREDPLTVWDNSYNSSLKFVRKVCEVAQEDLTDFFTAWGFFEPFSNLAIDDYGAHTMTVRNADITRTKNIISKYPKNNTILFVEDRAQYVLTTDFLTTAGQKRRDSDRVGLCGELGQFTDFLPGATGTSEYTYLQADSLYMFSGTGGVGFLMLDSEGKMCYAANALSFCIPSCVKTDFTIYSVDADGTLHEVTKAGEGAEYVVLEASGTLPDSLSKQAIKATIGGPVNGTDIKYMRQLISEGNLRLIDLSGAKIVAGGTAYYGNYRTSANTMGSHAFHECKKLISIRLPETLSRIADNAFSNSGLKEAVIPESVVSVGGDAYAYCDMLSRVTVGSKVKSMDKGVFYSSAVKDAYVKPLTPPSVSAYLFSSNPIIHVYSKALAAYKASDWAQYGTLVGDLDDYTDEVEEIHNSQFANHNEDGVVYDLSGRKIVNRQSVKLKRGVYIQNGKRIVVR